MGHGTWGRGSLVVGAALLSGCGGEESLPTGGPPPVPPGSCGPAEVAAPDGGCCPAGTIPNAEGPCCPAGTTPQPGGACEPAGIPPELCSDGFVPDGASGCAPILPADPCPEGQLAVPGDETCRELSACVGGRWGAIPIDASTQFVDAAYGGTDSDGSEQRPWTSIQAAVDAAAPDGLIAIAAGSYPEAVWIEDQPVRLWGVCAAQTEIRAPSDAMAAISVGADAHGTEIRDLAITGSTAGVGLSGSHHVVIERVWIHDTASTGLDVESAWGPTEATLRASLIERASDLGVLVVGASVRIEGSVVRDTQPAGPLTGRGLHLWAAPTNHAPATVVLHGSVVEGCRDVAVLVAGSGLTVDGSVLRDTQPDSENNYGLGLHAMEDDYTGAPCNVTIRGSMIANNREAGILAQGARLLVETTVVRDTWPNAVDELGRGIETGSSPVSGSPGELALRRSVVERSHEFGVLVGGVSATIESTIIRSTQRNSLPWTGWGIEAIADSFSGFPTNLVVRGSVVEDNHTAGVFVGSATGLVEGTAIRRTMVDGRGWYGRGVEAVVDPAVGLPASVTVRHSTIESSHDAGIFVYTSHATVEGVLVTDTAANDDGAFGDGLVVIGSPGLPATVELSNSALRRNVRAGLANFGASVTTGGNRFDCNPIHLNGEQQYSLLGYQVSLPYAFDNRGDNQCGCGAQTEPCRVSTTGLEPPRPVSESEQVRSGRRR